MTEDNDPVLAAYQGIGEEQQESFRNLFAADYTDDQIAAALIYLTGAELTAMDVRRFRRKLSLGKVAW